MLSTLSRVQAIASTLPKITYPFTCSSTHFSTYIYVTNYSTLSVCSTRNAYFCARGLYSHDLALLTLTRHLHLSPDPTHTSPPLHTLLVNRLHSFPLRSFVFPTSTFSHERTAKTCGIPTNFDKCTIVPVYISQPSPT